MTSSPATESADLPHYGANRTLVCFRHRYTAKVPVPQLHAGIVRRCPMCGEPLANCGRNFSTPKVKDDKGWVKAEQRFLEGRFST